MKPYKFIAAFALIVATLVITFTYFIAKNSAQKELQQSLRTQLLQVVNELKITLERHSYLPSLLSTDTKIINFMNSNNKEVLEEQLKVNLSLELINNISESSAIYIMKPNGTTVASSNWESESSFIGKNFAFRPYFQQAMQNTLGRYYAVGAVSGERGYFFASSITDKGKTIGVIAVKVAIEDIEFTWGEGSFDFMVTDPNSVIFLSSQKDWNLHSLVPLSEKKNSQFVLNRRYGSSNITVLSQTSLDLTQADFQTIQLLGKTYEMLTQEMKLVHWDVRVISQHSNIQKSIITSLLIMTLILLLLTALAVLLWKTQQQKKRYQQQITEELENEVAERTKALKQTQEDLIQAAKMAALGQLSAGIAHEINNPLTAIRAYADNANQFLKKDQLNMVASNLEEITSLTESMATITKQLKSFSRKSKGQIKPVMLKQSINSALSIVNTKITSAAITCHWDTKSHGTNKSVLADEIWLGQILVNLLSNAISAVQQRESPEIWIKIKTNEKSLICIQVEDNGLGIEESTLPRIFEPFFTTKPSSKGLGLGLSISFNLAKDMNGSLSTTNTSNGAQFNLCLPNADK